MAFEYIPVIRITVAKSFGERVTCYLQLCYLPNRENTVNIDRGQTREICEKQEKYRIASSKGKVVTYTVQSLIFYHYPVHLQPFNF